jgi:hypothetical protein
VPSWNRGMLTELSFKRHFRNGLNCTDYGCKVTVGDVVYTHKSKMSGRRYLCTSCYEEVVCADLRRMKERASDWDKLVDMIVQVCVLILAGYIFFILSSSI